MTMPSAVEFDQASPQKYVEFRIYLACKSRSGLQSSRAQQKCASVLDFSRSRCSLQLGGVQWTSPQRFTHSFDSLHLARDANLQKATEIPLEEKARKDAAKFG